MSTSFTPPANWTESYNPAIGAYYTDPTTGNYYSPTGQPYGNPDTTVAQGDPWAVNTLNPQAPGTPAAINGLTAQQVMSPGSTTTTGGGGAQTGTVDFNYSPSTISSQFPNGIPQINPQQVTGVQSVNAQQISPWQAVNATEAYLNPQFQQQDQALAAELASAGIVGGTSGQAQAQLGQQQQTTLQNNIQPYLQTAATSNQSANLAAQEANQGTNLAGQEFNAGQGNTAQSQNISNLLQTAGTDASTYNAMQQYIMGLQNQDYLANLGAQTNLATTAEGATTSAFNPVYQQPSTINLSGIGSAFAPSNYNSSVTPSPTTNQTTNYNQQATVQ